ncbi:MAG TPA: tetraacyldisaccharide 4'-kinase [Bacteroidaceae bacterium]|nr:tetraacyldisaccharide 4'-kinase [Bacteroidaceae bacterium]
MVKKRYPINRWLLPASWIFGFITTLRNWWYDKELLKSVRFNFPVISIGNITVGGTGKTPHTEYLIRLLKEYYRIAVLSRGYKRYSKGFILADTNTDQTMIGDEPFQIKQKFPDITVAVHEDRVKGIQELGRYEIPDVILLDDAYQHRKVKPSLNILLIDYNRIIFEDTMLPAGRLREPARFKDRADIIIYTKCPKNLSPMDLRILIKKTDPFPYQKLYFSTLKYSSLKPLCNETSNNTIPLKNLNQETSVLLVSGIASPESIEMELKKWTCKIIKMSYKDHHWYTNSDILDILKRFEQIKTDNKIIVTTEKDAVKLKNAGSDRDFLEKVFVLPVYVDFIKDKDKFKKQIIGHIKKFKNRHNNKPTIYA